MQDHSREREQCVRKSEDRTSAQKIFRSYGRLVWVHIHERTGWWAMGRKKGSLSLQSLVEHVKDLDFIANTY